MKLGLGTAQFGFPYGVTNAVGQISEEEGRRIVTAADENGVDIIDTAAGYGESEAILGRLLRAERFKIVTKSLSLPTGNGAAAVESVYVRFQKSLEYLGVEQLHGLLIHRAADLLGPHGDRLFERLSTCQSTGQILRFGVSVYTPEEAFLAVERYPLTLIQFPLNALDQRMVASGALRFLRERGLELHARSIFLQGALLAEPGSGGVSAELVPYIAGFREIASSAGMTPLEVALAFVAGQDIDVAIVGITSSAEFSEILSAFNRGRQLECPPIEFSIADSKLIDPRCWSARA